MPCDLRIDRLVDKVQAARPAWQHLADPASTEAFADAIDELRGAIDEHFDHEERDVVLLIAKHVTPTEWQAFIDRGAAYVKSKNVRFALAYGVSSCGTQHSMSNAVAPTRCRCHFG